MIYQKSSLYKTNFNGKIVAREGEQSLLFLRERPRDTIYEKLSDEKIDNGIGWEKGIM